MLYQYNFDKPELSDNLLDQNGASDLYHYNHNHDPRNGQFTTGSGGGSGSSSGGGLKKKKASGGSGSISRKRKKALKKARKTRATNAKRKIQEQKVAEKKQQEEKKKQLDKEKIIKDKDVNKMLKNVDQFTTNEINDMLYRLTTEQRLASAVNERKPLGKRIKEGAKEAAIEGAKKYGKDLVKNLAYNSLDLGVRELSKQIVGKENKDMVDLVNQLLRDRLKK